jgi:hypothetical protein
VKKAMTGETLKIFASGNQSEIKSMMHGQADALVRRFHTQSQLTPADVPASAAQQVDDPLAQLERLGQLRDKGLLSDEEFEAKKIELLGRL